MTEPLTNPSPPRPNLRERADELFPRLDRWAKAVHVDGDLARMLTEAATLIDSLLSERDEALGALKPFAGESRAFEGDVSDDLHLTVRDEDGETVNTTISVGDLRRAARAMRGNAE